ncbi:hypothetical protein LPA44_10715 [Halobacterium sp. KA-4]|jgi:hypothetical protein|uniref:hypothetical protein n=1 Tax=Halobacterium sp. KA-4 TaxID=2896367 RepID=UPI001E55FE45|nr:hypothetical protein [Halobacterium sp. KA-4]MCD2200363.1 hypothetical protein [Halobacterium sp. KA-4]
MALSVWEVFLTLFGGGEDSEEEEEAESRFVPSPLDLSVRIGHGGSDSQRVRELAEMSERAEEIEEERGN